MEAKTFFLVLALISCVAYAQITTPQQPTSVWTVKKSSDIGFYNTRLQNPVVFQYGTVTVPRQLWTYGLHAIAYRQLTYLYPSYRTFPIRSCTYTVYGPSRIYTFQLLNAGGQSIRLFSSVQNNDQATGYQTQQTASQQAKAWINANDANKQQKVDDSNSGFSVIKLSRAYQIPRVVLAIKYITRINWSVIRSAPLVRCLQKWQRGTYSFRLYFNGVPNWFQYTHLADYISLPDELQVQKPNLRTVDTSAPKTNNVVPKTNEQYLPRQKPIFTVRGTDGYQYYTLASFRNHYGYSILTKKLNDHFGWFDQKWISKIQYRVDDSDIHYFQFQIRFVPFLVDVDLEAHYYGSTKKAALLQIDQKVFDLNQNKKLIDNWSEIKNFNSYRAFRQTNEYVLSQFTYLRLYKVTAAYSALHKNGRLARLVYQSQNNFFGPNGQNQFNILVYICDGKFYIDREDFKATNTAASPKNDWVSLFVKVADVKSHSSYPLISKFFTSKYWSFWNAHRVEDIQIRDGVHVIRFRNLSPSVVIQQQIKQCVLRIRGSDVVLLNHFDWRRVDEQSIHWVKAVNYAGKKFINYVPIFINSKVTPYGRHFQLCYLDQKRNFANVYLRYVDAEDLITDDQWQGIAYTVDFQEVPLPVNPQQGLTQWVITNYNDVVAVVDIKTSSKNAYQCVALTQAKRWTFNINWVRGQWVLVSKELVNDGYYFVTGYPSVNVASCTGYLARLYPNFFVPGWLYGAIEVKNIGYFVYTRVIYRVGSVSYQGVVRTTYGVQNSHSLISWDRIRLLKELRDYGYGDVYDWSYGLSSRYFFDYIATPRVLVNEVKVATVVVEKNDLLCAFYESGKCIACYGDYYADQQGICRKVQDSCLFWQVTGKCSYCSYGWRVDSFGKCVAEVTFLLV